MKINGSVKVLITEFKSDLERNKAILEAFTAREGNCYEIPDGNTWIIRATRAYNNNIIEINTNETCSVFNLDQDEIGIINDDIKYIDSCLEHVEKVLTRSEGLVFFMYADVEHYKMFSLVNNHLRYVTNLKITGDAKVYARYIGHNITDAIEVMSKAERLKFPPERNIFNECFRLFDFFTKEIIDETQSAKLKLIKILPVQICLEGKNRGMYMIATSNKDYINTDVIYADIDDLRTANVLLHEMTEKTEVRFFQPDDKVAPWLTHAVNMKLARVLNKYLGVW